MFTVVDRATRWPEAIPMRDMMTSCATFFTGSWVARFGFPAAMLMSDHGSQFVHPFGDMCVKSWEYDIHTQWHITLRPMD